MKSLWLMLIGALSLVIAVEWFLPVQEPPVPSYSKLGASGNNQVNLLAKADHATEFPPLEQYQSVKDRPLFFEGRRPPAEHTPEPKGKQKKPDSNVSPPRASLSGVIRVGDNVYVMLKGVGKEKGLARVKVGEDVDGWKVERIHDDRVVLKKGKEKHEIPLRSYKAVPLPKSEPATRRGTKKEKDMNKAAARKKALAARRARKKEK